MKSMLESSKATSGTWFIAIMAALALMAVLATGCGGGSSSAQITTGVKIVNSTDDYALVDVWINKDTETGYNSEYLCFPSITPGDSKIISLAPGNYVLYEADFIKLAQFSDTQKATGIPFVVTSDSITTIVITESDF